VKVARIETLGCDAGWRNYHFVKLTTSDGIVGWSEYSEDFGSPGIGAVIARLSAKVVGQKVSDHERIYAELYAATRPAAGGVVAQGIAALAQISNTSVGELPESRGPGYGPCLTRRRPSPDCAWKARQ